MAPAAPRKPAAPRGPRQPVGTKTGRPYRITASNQAAQDRSGLSASQDQLLLAQEERYEFGFPPSLEDYRALLTCSLRSLTAPPLRPAVVFDRTPLDYLAYLAAAGADPSDQAGAASLRPAFASLDLLVITLITPETEQVLPAPELPGLRAGMNDALLELVYDDPLDAWGNIPVLELSGPLDGRPDAVLAALAQSR